MVEESYNFQQKLANESKCGAYYTDLAHCRSLAGAFQWGKSTLILEPSIGDGSAVKQVCQKKTGDGKYIFGVELNVDTYSQTKQDSDFEVILNADFVHGTRASNGVFTFCFANPPYGEDERGKRLETPFIERIHTLMKRGGIACFVIPKVTLEQLDFQRTLVARFDTMYIFKFREPEYSKFHQYVIIAERKEDRPKYFRKELEEFQELVESPIEELPEVWEDEPIVVPTSGLQDISLFATQKFDPDEVIPQLDKCPLRKVEQKLTKQAAYGVDEKHPPIPLKENHIYLVSSSGVGQGRAGREEDGTLHYQRGNAKRVEKTNIVESKKGTEEVVTQTTQITIKIVEADGTIRELK